MANQCKALIINCMDFRLPGKIRDFAISLGLNGNYDHVSLAGGAKNLVVVEDACDREFLIKQIELAKNLHGVEQVILINHTNCGAYEAFKSKEEERERHLDDLRNAKKVILERWLGLEVVLVLARIGKEGEVSFERF